MESGTGSLGAWVLAASLALGCTKPTPPPLPEDEFDRSALLENLAQNVYLPTYREVVSAAQALETAAAAHASAQGVGDAERTAVRTAFGEAMTRVQEAELYQVGPAGSPGTMTGGLSLRDELYSWPTVSACRVDQVVAENRFNEPTFFDGALVNLYGLDALEYLLFVETDANACGPTTVPNSNGAWSALSVAEVKKRRAAYAHVLATKLVADAQRLLSAWAPEGQNFAGALAQAGKEGSAFPTAQEAVDQIFASMFYLDQDVKDRKLALPSGISVDCETEVCTDKLESLYAKRNAENLKANLAGFKAVLVGGRAGQTNGIGFDDFLKERDAADLATEMVTEVDAASAAVDAVSGTFEEALNTQPEQVRAVHAAVKQVTDVLKSQFVTVLNLRVPEEGAADND